MRNTTLRKNLDTIANLVNDAVNKGIEPLALAISLRNMADQLDRLASALEKQEAEQKESEGKNADEPSV